MNVIVVDDERLVLTTETLAVKRVLPNAEINSFMKAREAIEYAYQNKVDIAFLDIKMKGITGLQLAEQLKITNPKMNIIFCTGYSEYSLEALDLYCSAYLMKPITDDALIKAIENLRHPILNEIKGLKVCCFGNFEVYFNGYPIKFKHKKTKELFAYLIDRCGSTVSTREMVIALYEDDSQLSYMHNLRADLTKTLTDLGIGETLVRDGGNIGVNKAKIDCDYYEYLAGNKSLFRGEYMLQYSFAENTLAWLLNENCK